MEKESSTKFGRLMAALIIGMLGLDIALLTPTTLLLTLRVTELDPKNAVSAFGLVTGIGAFIALFANPIGGAISDRTRFKLGRRRTWIIVGCIAGSISTAIIGMASQIWVIGLCWCITCIFYNFAQASYVALIADQIPESKRGAVSGIIGMLSIVSIVIGMVIMSAIVNAGSPAKWITIAVIGAVAAVISVSLIKDPQKEYKKPETSKMSIGSALSRVYPSPRKYPAFTWGVLTRLCVTVAYCSTSYNSMMLMQRFHYTQAQTTNTVTLISLIGMVCLLLTCVFGGAISDKIRKQKPFVMFSPIVVAIGIVFMAIAPSILYIYIGSALCGLGYGMYSAVDLALIVRILPRKSDAAKDMGIMNVANALPQSIVPFLAPTLLSVGSWPFFYGFLAIFGLFSSLSVIPIPEISPISAVPDSVENV